MTDLPPNTAPITLEEEMRRSYLDYAMSVIVSRALPDARDGLKPVHRRILYAMKEGGYDWNRPHRKSARIVGDVMGLYHPHGDNAIYDAMVRMAQDFSMRLKLIDGQGNFGSMDADPPAAMRYTEARLARVAAQAMLEDIDRDTVAFQPNYDETTTEPVVLPARFPNLLVNGAGGIAVGMATNIPTHNLGEVIDATLAWIDDPAITVDELMKIMPGPDFPTGGVILGRAGARSAYETGRGSIMLRAVCAVEEIRKDREAIIVTEIPYQVNKARLTERIAELVNDKVIEGISDLRDESDRDGVRLVIELKRDASADVVLNQLYRHSALQTSFGANMLALDGGRPEVMPLTRILEAFVAFREEVIRRRTAHELGKARERAHLLVGLAIAVANIDPIIAAIRAAPNPEEARHALLSRRWPADSVAPLVALVDDAATLDADRSYQLTEAQARGILELRLQRLTGLEREKIGDELNGLVEKIADFLKILSDRSRLFEVLREELEHVKAEFAQPRKTRFEESAADFEIEDLIEREEMVVTVTHGGYIKRTPLSTYRAQKRGGRGRAGMATRDEDFVAQVFVASTHAPILFFTSRGIVYKLKVHRLPFGQPQARGKAMVNLLPLEPGETVSTVLPLPEDEAEWEGRSILFATSAGTVRRNNLADFTNVKANGKIAMKLDEAGESIGRLVGVRICGDGDDAFLATRAGRCIRFPISGLRVFAGRNSLGVRGVKLGAGDAVIGVSILGGVDASAEERELYLRAVTALGGRDSETDGAIDGEAHEAVRAFAESPRYRELAQAEQFVLTVTARGFGKRTSSYAYRVTGRGGQGVVNIDVTARNGEAVAVFPAPHDLEVMMVTDGGQLIRCPVKDVRVAGRRTQGVTLIRVAEGERVVSAAPILDMGEEEDAEDGREDGGDAGPEAPE